MLQITIPDTELYDEDTREFYYVKKKTLTLEYSLVAISKWESKWKKPFTESKTRTVEEMQDFIKCMTITQNVDPMLYKAINIDTINEVIDYMNDPMTATTFSNEKNSSKKEIVTSELVYYWMSALQLPMECQKWHFNRLMVLIHIASEKNQPPKKMPKGDIFRQNKAINAQRRAKYKSRG